MNKKIRIIIISAMLIFIAAILLCSIFIKEKGIEINEINFPEQIVREVAAEADKNKNGILSEKESGAVKKLYLKKLKGSDLADVLEVYELPSYTNADFYFDFEGIQHFYNAEELTINLADGEFFNKESDEEQIFVQTSNLEKIYELKNLKKIYMHEVELETVDIQQFPKLELLSLQFMYNMKEFIPPEHNALNEIWLLSTDTLEAVDLSNLSNIEHVYIRFNNNLNTLKFGEKNTKLEEFDVMNLPKLQNVDLSPCANLKTLYIREVPITSLDVSKNTKLETAGFFGLLSETLDLTNNPEVTYLINDNNSFQNIIIPDNNIISWIRWINSDIEEFPLKNLNPATLIGIDIQGTKIKELDITQYLNLETLYYDVETTTIIGDIDKLKSIEK